MRAMNTSSARTPLYDWHAAHHGRIVDFAGWSMPVQYSSIVDEHQAVRTSAGLFDVSHMGRLVFEGRRAGEFLDRLLTRRVLGLAPGKIRYSLVTNERGGILDDVLVYHLLDAQRGPFYVLVVNASNRAKIVDWLTRHGGDAPDVGMSDRTLSTAMIAVQGPQALSMLQPLVAHDLNSLGYYAGATTKVDEFDALVSRTGYTGEDGCELTVPASAAVEIWEHLVARGAKPAGLGSRDTLRLEAGMPLYGHELSEALTPLHADLAYAVNFDGREFVGRDALLQVAASPLARRRVGLSLEGKRVPRETYGVFAAGGGGSIGEVTSGTFSPTFSKPIAMAYVDAAHAEVGTQVEVDIRGQRVAAVVTKLPFYSRPKRAAAS